MRKNTRLSEQLESRRDVAVRKNNRQGIVAPICGSTAGEAGSFFHRGPLRLFETEGSAKAS